MIFIPKVQKMKTLDMILNRHSTEETITTYPLHMNQDLYRKGLSTETALHSNVQKAEKIYNKEVAVAIFFSADMSNRPFSHWTLEKGDKDEQRLSLQSLIKVGRERILRVGSC